MLTVEELRKLGPEDLAREIAKTRVVNIDGIGLDPGIVYIGRGTLWGNPFVRGRDGTREEVIHRYELYVEAMPELLEELWSLVGRTLGCHCHPLPCHGHVLLKLIKTYCVASHKNT